MAQNPSFSLVKPTLDTPFYIDFKWWREHDSNWRVFLRDFLCDQHREIFSEQEQDVKIDFVDPETAEVKKVDGLYHTLINHCAKQSDFISGSTSMVNTIFKVFLVNDNKPLTPNELAELSGKSATTILRTFSSVRVFKGIRPYHKK